MDGIINSRDISLRDNEVQERLACCSPWGHKESDTMEQLNNNKERQNIARKIKMQIHCFENMEKRTVFRVGAKEGFHGKRSI